MGFFFQIMQTGATFVFMFVTSQNSKDSFFNHKEITTTKKPKVFYLQLTVENEIKRRI